MGEGLQHDDGQSPLLASTNPAALVYDASFAYEVAVIMEAAIAEMLGPAPKDRFWYLTLYNETYPMPALPEGADGEAVRRGIIEGIYRFAAGARREGRRTCGRRCASRGRCGASPWRRSSILAERYGVAADAWAVTSWTRLRTDALEVERWNRLHPEAEPRTAIITAALGAGPDPVVAITDYMRARARPGGTLRRPALRLARDRRLRALRCPRGAAVLLRGRRANLVVAVLQQLALGGRVEPAVVAGAIDEFGIDPEGAPPSSSERPERERHEHGEHLLGAVGHRQDEGPPVGLQGQRDVEEGAARASRAAPGPPPRSTRRRASHAAPGAPRWSPVSTADTRRRHQRAPAASAPPTSAAASRLQAIGRSGGSAVIGAGSPRGLAWSAPSARDAGTAPRGRGATPSPSVSVSGTGCSR